MITPYFRNALKIAQADRRPGDWTATPARLARNLSAGTWQSTPHLEFLSNDVAECATGPIFRIYNMPPRHGKSELFSHWLPVWFLKKFPWKRVGLASYEMGFAQEWGGKTKDSIVEHADQLGLEMARDTKAKGHWKLKGFGGGMSVAGIGGPITGRGFDLIIVDDPIKNAQEALSKTYRERLWNWYKTTLRTRLEPGGSIIIIMTRWHEADLAGKLTTPEEGDPDDPALKDPWRIVNIPAIAERNDILGRAEGDALWPARFDLPALAKLRYTLGPFWFAAMFQGRPQPEGGGIIKEAWFKYFDWDQVPKNDKGEMLFPRTIQIWDTAFKENQAADRSACLTLATGPLGFYLLDLFVKRLEYPDLIAAAKNQAARWNPDHILIEDKASGISLIQQLKRDSRLPIKAIKAEDDKVTRAHSVTGVLEAGRVFLPARAPWIPEFMAEVTGFPTGQHDDIPDVLVHGLRYFHASLSAVTRRIIGEGRRSPWAE